MIENVRTSEEKGEKNIERIDFLIVAEGFWERKIARSTAISGGFFYAC